ncbi:MAG: YraN family protein [Rickettsiaceae bacterium]|nr:YraN family protein [Rickettsiaceae bacterium]
MKKVPLKIGSWYKFGLYAEYFVIFIYMLRFYKILKHRMRNYASEIDIICVRNRTLVFVEVKARTSDVDDILCSMSQQKKIRRAAEMFLYANPKYSGYDIRFDLVVVRPYKFPQIIQNAW